MNGYAQTFVGEADKVLLCPFHSKNGNFFDCRKNFQNGMTFKSTLLNPYY